MTTRTLSTVISLIASFGVSSALNAERPNKPILGEILQRLEANLNHFDTSVPSFFCDEHVISKIEPDLIHGNTTTDSIFRLKRTSNSDHTTTLAESRDIKSVNGKPATKQDMDGPSLLSGWFEGSLAMVSPDQARCMNYTLQRIDTKRPNEPYSIRFATVLTPQNSASCLLQENSKGRVIIDPASMQITHLEITTPHHTIIPGNTYRSPVVGERVVDVDYAPVVLDGKTFWMPSAIAMRVTRDKGTFHMTVWSYRATYSNYHKLEVTSRIYPANEQPLP